MKSRRNLRKRSNKRKSKKIKRGGLSLFSKKVVGPIVYDDGKFDVYIGNLNKTGKADGKGKMYYWPKDYKEHPLHNEKITDEDKINYINYKQNTPLYNIYEGSFKDGQKNGEGVMIYNNNFDDYNQEYYESNSKYSGNWVNDEKSGQGVMKYKNGDEYDGGWKNDKKSGKGIMKYFITILDAPDKYKEYYGDWVDDKITGEGVMKYKNNDEYNGNWVDNKKSGKGVMTYADGSKYDGNWLEDEKSGKGVMTDADGSVYDGYWLYDNRSGEGTMTYKDGSKYDGTWIDNNQNIGIMKYNSNNNQFHAKTYETYDGYWYGNTNTNNKTAKINYRPNSDSNFKLYDGEVSDQQPNGTGTMTYVNGDKYIGEWEKGNHQGKGTMTYTNGDRFDGKFGSYWAKGKMTYANGDIYDGDIKFDTYSDSRGKKDGPGEMIIKNNNIVKYEFWNDGTFIRDISLDEWTKHKNMNKKQT